MHVQIMAVSMLVLAAAHDAVVNSDDGGLPHQQSSQVTHVVWKLLPYAYIALVEEDGKGHHFLYGLAKQGGRIVNPMAYIQ